MSKDLVKELTDWFSPPEEPGDYVAMRAAKALDGIAKIIETVENRCMAVDGPVTNTRLEMTDRELRQIWLLASGSK